QRVSADIAMVPGDELRIAVRGAAAREGRFPVVAQVRVEIGRAERSEVQLLPVEVLAQRPARIDMPDGTHRRARLGGEAAVADMFRRGLERAHEPREEDLVVFGGAGAA